MRPPTRLVVSFALIRKLRIPLLLATIAFAGFAVSAAAAGETPRLTPERAAAVDRAVRTFMQTVADDVTHDGPTAWLTYFDTGPAFFMAVNGQMAFPNSAAAQEGTRKFAQAIRHIELKWSDDLRVDPLAANLAVVAASWHETIDNPPPGFPPEQAGYFTALVEYRDGHWLFRDAHWSSPVPACH